MISVRYRHSRETGVQLDGKNFARRSALTFVGGSLNVDWGNKGTFCQGTLPTDLILFK